MDGNYASIVLFPAFEEFAVSLSFGTPAKGIAGVIRLVQKGQKYSVECKGRSWLDLIF